MKSIDGDADRQLVESLLVVIRREFFRKTTEKQFFQERRTLEQAILFPAVYLADRGAELPLDKYRPIIQTVIATIRKHGNRAKIKRFSVYFLHSVQEHMKHHGDDYLQLAKNIAAGRPVRELIPGAMPSRAQPSAASPTSRALAIAGDILRSRGGRKKKRGASQIELI